MKKTSWILALLVMVVMTTVGIAYGQGYDLFGQFISEPQTFTRLTERAFSPPPTPMARWFRHVQDPEPIDFGQLLLARAEKEAAAAAIAANHAPEKTVAVSNRGKTPSQGSTPPSDSKTDTTKPVTTKPPETTKPPAEDPPPADKPTVNPLKPPAGTAATSSEKKVFDLVNHARVAEGLKPLILSTDLVWLARLRSEDLVAHGGTLTHNTPTYGNTGQMLQNAGISYKGCGENLAKTFSAERAVERWLASDKGHRENMLSPNFTHTGVGIARLDSTYIIISQVFINQSK